jgi:hypothetical protein
LPTPPARREPGFSCYAHTIMRYHHTSIVALAILVMFTIAPAARSQAQARNQFTLKVSPGPDYKASTRILLFITIPIHPQIACWLETPEGAYVDTIYATAKGAKKDFYSAPAGRPEALPVWYHRQAAHPASVDAISGATAAGAAEHVAKLPIDLSPGRYVAFLEVNRSYDYNGRYTKQDSGVNGQPSIIYRAEIVVGSASSMGVFSPIGTGSVDGSNGNITPGLDGITTALTLIDKAEIDYSGK